MFILCAHLSLETEPRVGQQQIPLLGLTQLSELPLRWVILYVMMCAGFFKPAKASSKKRSQGDAEKQPPLAAAYKAVIEAQITEGTELPQARSGTMLQRSVTWQPFLLSLVLVLPFMSQYFSLPILVSHITLSKSITSGIYLHIVVQISPTAGRNLATLFGRTSRMQPLRGAGQTQRPHLMQRRWWLPGLAMTSATSSPAWRPLRHVAAPSASSPKRGPRQVPFLLLVL